MRAPVIAIGLGLAACGPGPIHHEPTPDAWEWTGGDPPPPGGVYGCHADSECGTELVCSRTYECLAPSEVRAVRVRWTFGGAAPTAASCSGGDLAVGFTSNIGESHGYAPVPCIAGVFSIDKLPIRFDGAMVGSLLGSATSAPLDATGTAVVDL